MELSATSRFRSAHLRCFVSPLGVIYSDFFHYPDAPCVPGSKLVIFGMAIPPLIGNPYNGYIKPYYWVDDHPLLYGNNGSLDPSTSREYLPSHFPLNVAIFYLMYPMGYVIMSIWVLNQK